MHAQLAVVSVVRACQAQPCTAAACSLRLPSPGFINTQKMESALRLCLVLEHIHAYTHTHARVHTHAGAAGSRRWSALARWRLRELNELPHYCSHRLDAAHAPACHYCAQVCICVCMNESVHECLFHAREDWRSQGRATNLHASK